MVEVAREKLKLAHLVSGKKNAESIHNNDNEIVEINKILKFGTEKIFEETKGQSDTEYSREFINSLCDRGKIFAEQKKAGKPEEKDQKINDYFSMFKEAKTQQKDTDAEWEQIIGKEIQQIKLQELLLTGKGMRKRNKNIKYKEVRMPKDHTDEDQDDEGEEDEQEVSNYNEEPGPQDVLDDLDAGPVSPGEERKGNDPSVIEQLMRIGSKKNKNEKPGAHKHKIRTDNNISGIHQKGTDLGFKPFKKRDTKKLFAICKMTKEERNENKMASSVNQQAYDADIEYMGSVRPVNQDNKKSETSRIRQRPFSNELPPAIKYQKTSEEQKNAKVVKNLSDRNKFDLKMVEKYTNNKFFLELIRIHNDGREDDFICFGLNKNQQREFMSMLMRYGLKGSSLQSLYRMVKTVNDYRKNLKIMQVPIETFVAYGSKIVEFIEFLYMIPQFRSLSHFSLNFNSAEKVKYCVYSIKKLERIYGMAEAAKTECLFEAHPEYKKNVQLIAQGGKEWYCRDDYLLLSCVLNHGFNNYKRISNALRWLKTNKKVEEYSKTRSIENQPYKILKELDYKMPWECLFERVFRFDIRHTRKHIFRREEVREKMMSLKNELEKFLSSRIEYLLIFEKTKKPSGMQ